MAGVADTDGKDIPVGISLQCNDNNDRACDKSCKDLLRVRPESGLEKYLVLKKDVSKAGIPQKTFKPSACKALRQVKDFLPVMKKAQEELDNKDDVNIENVEEDRPYIDMDVQLFELQDSESSSESELEAEKCHCTSDADTDDDDDKSCHSETGFDIREVTTENFVVTKPKAAKKPLIEDIT